MIRRSRIIVRSQTCASIAARVLGARTGVGVRPLVAAPEGRCTLLPTERDRPRFRRGWLAGPALTVRPRPSGARFPRAKRRPDPADSGSVRWLAAPLGEVSQVADQSR
jgi:hypothetical protein